MFDINKVTRVYSGRKGCACGCRGNYSTASQYRDSRPSYQHDSDDGISDRAVKSIVNKVTKFICDPTSDVARVIVDDRHGDWIAVDMKHDRTYTIYFV